MPARHQRHLWNRCAVAGAGRPVRPAASVHARSLDSSPAELRSTSVRHQNHSEANRGLAFPGRLALPSPAQPGWLGPEFDNWTHQPSARRREERNVHQVELTEEAGSVSVKDRFASASVSDRTALGSCTADANEQRSRGSAHRAPAGDVRRAAQLRSSLAPRRPPRAAGFAPTSEARLRARPVRLLEDTTLAREGERRINRTGIIWRCCADTVPQRREFARTGDAPGSYGSRARRRGANNPAYGTSCSPELSGSDVGEGRRPRRLRWGSGWIHQERVWNGAQR